MKKKLTYYNMFTQSQSEKNTIHSAVTSEDESPGNKLAHLLIQDDEQSQKSFKNNTKHPSPHAVVNNFSEKYGGYLKAAFERIIRKKNPIKVEDILLTADIRVMQPSEVVARMFGEKGYKNHISQSDQSILNFYSKFTDVQRRRLRVLYEDADRLEKNKKWLNLLPQLSTIPEEDEELILSLIEKLSR